MLIIIIIIIIKTASVGVGCSTSIRTISTTTTVDSSSGLKARRVGTVYSIRTANITIFKPVSEATIKYTSTSLFLNFCCCFYFLS